jgi:hypothetical protein
VQYLGLCKAKFEALYLCNNAIHQKSPPGISGEILSEQHILFSWKNIKNPLATKLESDCLCLFMNFAIYAFWLSESQNVNKCADAKPMPSIHLGNQIKEVQPVRSSFRVIRGQTGCHYLCPCHSNHSSPSVSWMSNNGSKWWTAEFAVFPSKEAFVVKSTLQIFTLLFRADCIWWRCEMNAHILERCAITCFEFGDCTECLLLSHALLWVWWLHWMFIAITCSVFKRIKGKEFLGFHVFFKEQVSLTFWYLPIHPPPLEFPNTFLVPLLWNFHRFLLNF